jgi:hypothetical protein
MAEAVWPPRSPDDAKGQPYLEQDIRDEERKQSNIVVIAGHLQILRHALNPRIS